MIKLVEKKNITNDIIQEFRLVKGDQLFECYLDNIIIGYAIISKKENDQIFLIVAEKYQNKGFGSEIFKLLLSKFTDSLKCKVDLNNYKMQRIILNNHGIEIGRNGKEILYLIELDNK